MTDRTIEQQRWDQASQLRYLLRECTAEERKAVWDYLQEDYCRHCGRDEPCACTDDE